MSIDKGPPEHAWLELLKKKDKDAWDLLFSTYAENLQSHINWLAMTQFQGIDNPTCKDVGQQTWVTVVENISSFEFRGDGCLYGWIRTIAYNHLRNTWRQMNGSANHSFQEFEDDSSLDNFLHQNGLFDDSPESKSLLRERMTALDAAMSELSARDREIVMRRFMWGEKPQELAEIYHLQPQTVSAIISKAKKKIDLQFLSQELFSHPRSYSIKGDE